MLTSCLPSLVSAFALAVSFLVPRTWTALEFRGTKVLLLCSVLAASAVDQPPCLLPVPVWIKPACDLPVVSFLPPLDISCREKKEPRSAPLLFFCL